MSIDFEHKTVVVTGGARGIGRAVVQAFAKAGANVVIADLRFEDAERTASEIGSCDCRQVAAVKTDVTKREDIDRLRDETLRMFGQIDVLVNCAGWDRLLPFLKTTQREVERHRCATRRIEQLLEQLGEPFEVTDELSHRCFG